MSHTEKWKMWPLGLRQSYPKSQAKDCDTGSKTQEQVTFHWPHPLHCQAAILKKTQTCNIVFYMAQSSVKICMYSFNIKTPHKYYEGLCDEYQRRPPMLKGFFRLRTHLKWVWCKWIYDTEDKCCKRCIYFKRSFAKCQQIHMPSPGVSASDVRPPT